MGIFEALRRFRSTVKLWRGQCAACQTPLRDDATTRFCSTACEDDYRLDSLT